ncbi:chemotaxis protein CheA [Brachyspira hampsonii]|uniref:Chemotaxis protein CheA n=1 Tax=Brachyspira hampsonii TaxID=1287055 RepID=A0AAC9TTY1_9SPIR|nr:chemotaxis protein CheA [Brachyspira hampsonii]ASJ20702.1 chemotaxis protein CheA [Brachyspira hampsonii]ELV06943.1 chemotaxis histidine kinase CheA [Brachyspira hampsonii 30599]MBW5381189.1 chemotaxis protein CheA [Brachyspira hampsonii]OEJ18121.1 chemotaxis protein CheA [Brachyspira hampsonii]
MDDYIKSLLKDFFEEAFEMLDRLEQNILILDNERNNVDAIQEIFRAVHTLKGSAGAVELVETQKYAHRFEDLLDLIRNNKIEVDDATIDVLLKGIDILKDLINTASEESEYSGDIEAEIKKLEDFKNMKLGAAPSASENDSPAASSATQAASPEAEKKVNKYELLPNDGDLLGIIRDNVEEGVKTKLVHVSFDPESPMRTVGGVQVFVALKDVGEIMGSIPPIESLEGDEFYEHVTYILATINEDKTIIDAITLPDATKEITIEDIVLEEYEKFLQEKKQKEAAEKTKESAAAASNASKKPDAAKGGKDHKVERQSSFLRVESDRIDAMMNQVGELVTNKSSYVQYDDDLTSYQKIIGNGINEVKRYYRDSIVQILRKFEEHLQKKEAKEIRNTYIDGFNNRLNEIVKMEEEFKNTLDKFRNSYQLLTRVTNELQETVMKIRMLPIAQTFNRFPRLIRDLSRDLGKEVKLEMYGEETELDKSVIEVLVDPLVHIIRNAMDHGIEHPEDREKAGKPRTGTVVLGASHEGNLIIIKISDDGKGMIPQKIFESAVKKGLVSADAKLSEKQMLEYIFAPGFSTATKITNVSGRGVGMDVVKKSLEKINGTVGIETEWGKGSTFFLRIPLTVAIIQALIVDAEKEYYAVPINSILETVKIDVKDIQELEGIEVIKVRDDVINVLSIKELFRLPSRYSNIKSYYAVILSSEGKKVALLVNNLIGEQDIVIKTLKDNITKSEGLAGATVLGDGTVSFILDIQTIVSLGTKRIIERGKVNNNQGSKNDLRSFIERLKNNEIPEIPQ